MESIDDPLTDSQTPSTTNTNTTTLTTAPPKPWSSKGRKQHKSTSSLMEAARSHNTTRGSKNQQVTV
ncbi:hypothetical protein JOB18_022502 [Solea senegalensis]|uniref:Uncharacterized protein n=1 Tax=Solea senegalensis TaxID=28829 RepID=A0AAV6QWT6_SOLSE|nr:hypothetical protein JOB18_022502 [Solea senegalensis]